MPIFLPGWEKRSRRIVRISIEAEMFLDFLRSLDGSQLLRCQDIPEDARVVALTVDELPGVVRLYVESTSFDEVMEGQATPELWVRFSTSRLPAGVVLWPTESTTAPSPTT